MSVLHHFSRTSRRFISDVRALTSGPLGLPCPTFITFDQTPDCPRPNLPPTVPTALAASRCRELLLSIRHAAARVSFTRSTHGSHVREMITKYHPHGKSIWKVSVRNFQKTRESTCHCRVSDAKKPSPTPRSLGLPLVCGGEQARGSPFRARNRA